MCYKTGHFNLLLTVKNQPAIFLMFFKNSYVINGFPEILLLE